MKVKKIIGNNDFLRKTTKPPWKHWLHGEQIYLINLDVVHWKMKTKNREE